MKIIRTYFLTLLLFGILAGAVVVRLYQFNFPVADWHSWRQVDTSAVSRNFIKYGFDVLHPKFDDFSKNVSLLDNPKGYRFVEFPLYNLVQASLFATFHYFTLEEWGRIVTIASQLIAIIFIFLLTKKYVSTRAGIIAASFYAFVPYNVYYGRTLLPDSSMVMASLGGIYFFDVWLSKEEKKAKNHWIYFLISFVFTASAFLLKPYALFFVLPLASLAFRRFGIRLIKKWQLWFYLIISLLPLVAWRIWMQQFPEGIPQSNWLFNQNGIRFKGAFFHWLFADRISSLILGFFGLPFVIIGLLIKNKKEGLLFYSLLASSLLYMTVMAYGNVHHDYYQILIIPTLAIFFGKGIDFLLEHSGRLFHRYTTYIVIIVCVAFMFAFSWFRVRYYYNIQQLELYAAGAAVDTLTPKDAKVIAPYGGNTTFLYQTNRRGWPVWDRELWDFIKAGAQYLVFVKPGADELNFKQYFPVVSEVENQYILYDLTKPFPAANEILKPPKKKAK